MHIHDDNQKLMEVVLGHEDLHVDAEQFENKELYKEFKKLDAKLNLVMNWLGRSLAHQQGIPQAQHISLSAKGIKFNIDKVLAVNDDLFIELFIEPNYPQPYITVGKVVSVQSQGGSSEVVVSFGEFEDLEKQWLDKYVFRIHRREIAMARKRKQML